MIAEVFPSVYDGVGRPVLRPSSRRHGFFGPNAPLGRHVTQPLNVLCADLAEVRNFLQGCRYVSDQIQFGRRDYWMPPEEFERRRRGDCDDFALWTWRQMMHLGYAARFVCGQSGRYGAGHAWVTIELHGRTHIVEALAARTGQTFPRLRTLRYKPSISASWDGRALRYYEHVPARQQVTLAEVAPHLAELVLFWMRWHPLMWWRLAKKLVGGGR